jgi:hypothetical protein
VTGRRAGAVRSRTPVTVLYLGGYSRSGSTIAHRLIAAQADAVAIGEICNVWQRSLALNDFCGCGARFSKCVFWSAVIRQTFEGLQPPTSESLHLLRNKVQGNHNFFKLLIPMLRSKSFSSNLRLYCGILQRLYAAISSVSQTSLVVDSSKLAPYAFLLAETPSIDFRVIHLVRDSRATAFSWCRTRKTPEVYWSHKGRMDRYGLIRCAIEWVVFNVCFELIRLRGVKYVRVRYEDLMRDPATVLASVSDRLDISLCEAANAVSNQTANLRTDHTAAGNPNRFEAGPIELCADVEWESKMPVLSKALVTVLTAPMLLRYGYFRSSFERLATGRTSSAWRGSR